MFLFPTSRHFCKDTCWVLAAASQLAYSKAAEADAIARQRGAVFFEFIEDVATDTQCFVAADFHNIVISFRGSSSVQDWFTDLKVRRQEFHGHSVHRGFAAGIMAIMPRIEAALQHCDLTLGRGWPSQNIWITGHSKGGAEAMLCAFALRKYPLRIRVYTFGQPRVGNSHFAQTYDLHFKTSTFRVVNEKDIVTRVPALLAGYRHCGTEIFLDAFGEIHEDYAWYRKIPSDLYGIAMSLDPVLPLSSTVGSPFKDHFVSGYLKRLEKK